MTTATDGKWQFWIDRGGTFTDIVAQRPDGRIVIDKLLSESPDSREDPAILGIRRIMGLAAGETIPSGRIEAVKMGTTIGTNALLERKGDRVVLVTNRGLRDVLRIGYQNRPKVFARQIKLPDLLYEDVVEVDGRYSAGGVEIEPLGEQGARAALLACHARGIRSVAIAFIHGYRHVDHERRVAEIAREIGFEQVSTSHQTSPLIKLVSRGDTTLVDAYLSPVLRRYVDRVAAQLNGVRLMFMQSNGGLVEGGAFQGKDCILSGPAGGIVGAVRSAEIAGFRKVISFDMGGTSTDVAHYDAVEGYERCLDTEIAGVRLRAPMIRIHTVAAGGGSICHFENGRFRVGPDSAGANPGPACYRRGGPLTITDCNVMVGKLQSSMFPAVFGANGDQPIDDEIVRRRFAELAQQVSRETGQSWSATAVAEGFLRVAVQNMANAIRTVSVQRGYDVTEYVLNCFGGAGGQHACALAESLGIESIMIHPYAGVLSAYGIGLAESRTIQETTVEEVLTLACLSGLAANGTRLAELAKADLCRQGVPAESIRVEAKAHIKYEGTDKPLPVEMTEGGNLRARFESAHHRHFGFIMPDKPVVVETLTVEAIGRIGKPYEELIATGDLNTQGVAPRHVELSIDGTTITAAVLARADLKTGDHIEGPAIITESTGTIVIEPGWRGTVGANCYLLLSRSGGRARKAVDLGDRADPVMLELFNNLFMSLAEQMGHVLENTSYSVNIKERLDFSCALFDADGGLIANAPHMPVHLGSMGDSVRTIIARRGGKMRHGDSFMLNDPYGGGTHLPDITVVTPVFEPDGSRIIFFVASRGHHADIGGITPGSMPPGSRHIDEEGVLIDNFQIVDGHRFLEAEVVELLRSGCFPARSVERNIGDLKAQLAANAKGAEELHQVVRHFGLETVQAYVRHVQENAAAQVRRALVKLEEGSFSQPLDNGSIIKVRVAIDRAAAKVIVDFTGTSPQAPDNFNAPRSVCRAAVLYVFRTLVDEDIPLNEGCMRPIELIVPEGCMLNPRYPAAVVAGNVETSQAITNCLYGALNLQAAAQGTMNNFTFGDETHQYYETICGGTGAGPGFDGVSAVQSHMTNSRLTDPEVLEFRFPVRLRAHRIRTGSGGGGRWHGGDGTVREIQFLRPMTASILANNRIVAPFGLNGGSPGKSGESYVIRRDGSRIPLASTDTVEVQCGDVFVIETPGGGGYGPQR